ncbi:hypothetical protein M9Y10_035213 [Tritrichomonas musculus]|uniref:Armadillo-type fold n=1 Tax=Tritrichomonas musculus TaxID=1915356 RepID=A0ABR2KH50_9EUKA
MFFNYKFEQENTNKQQNFANEQSDEKEEDFFLTSDDKKISIFRTCEEIHQLFIDQNSFKISKPINVLSNLIINEKLSSIPGFFQFDIPRILFQFLLLDKEDIRDASVSCLVNFSSYEQSEASFNSEVFCRNFLLAFDHEKMQSILEKMIVLFYNVCVFENQNINSFFILNGIIKILINQFKTSSNKQMIENSFDIISILCKSKLEKDDVLIIYGIICNFMKEYHFFNLYFIKIFYNLIKYESFLYEEFCDYKLYDFVNESLYKNKLNIEVRYAINVVKNLIQKYNCYQLFDSIQILNLLVIEPQIKEEEMCLLSIANVVCLCLDNDKDLYSNLLSENSFKNILLLAQFRDTRFKVAMIKLITRLVKEMKSNNFNLTFISDNNNQNIFNILDDLIETNEPDVVRCSLDLICLIFMKSTTFNLFDICKNLFQNVFTPSLFDKSSEFQDEKIIEFLYQIQSYLTAK